MRQHPLPSAAQALSIMDSVHEPAHQSSCGTVSFSLGGRTAGPYSISSTSSCAVKRRCSHAQTEQRMPTMQPLLQQLASILGRLRSAVLCPGTARAGCCTSSGAHRRDFQSRDKVLQRLPYKGAAHQKVKGLRRLCGSQAGPSLRSIPARAYPDEFWHI